MQYLGLLLLLLSILGSWRKCDAATSMGFFNDPSHPGKCAIQANLILSPGDKVKDPNQPCARIICSDKGLATFHTCGAVIPPAGCSFGDYIDQSLDYPDCCRKPMRCATGEYVI